MELVQGVGCLDGGMQLALCDQPGEVFERELDISLRRVPEPIDLPESMEGQAIEDQIDGRDILRLTAHQAVSHSGATELEELGKLPDRGTSDSIKNETKLLTCQSLFNLLCKVVPLDHDLVPTEMLYLLGSLGGPDDIQRLDTCKLSELGHIL